MAGGLNWLQGATQAGFHTTQWNLVVNAADTSEPVVQGALADLYRCYWPPLYAFARRHGNNRHDAEDAVQGFFVEIFENGMLSRADAGKGKFRTFLLGAFHHFLIGEWRHAHRQKRGGNAPVIPIEDAEIEAVEAGSRHPKIAGLTSPEHAFEQRWALTVMETSLRRLEAEAVSRGKGPAFIAVHPWLVGEPAAASQEESSAALGLTVAGFNTLIHRFRREFGNILRREVARTLFDPNDLEEEIQHLRKILGRVLP